MWIRQLLDDLNEMVEEPTLILEDNLGTIAITKNPLIHSRSKHIDIKYHHVREAVLNNIVTVSYCSTKDVLADIFTKPLNQERFEDF
jgi:hypothetical protein